MQHCTSSIPPRHPRRNQPAPVPSLEEIRERAAIERLAWDEETYEKRRVCHDASRGPYTIPIVSMTVDHDASGEGDW